MNLICGGCAKIRPEILITLFVFDQSEDLWICLLPESKE